MKSLYNLLVFFVFVGCKENPFKPYLKPKINICELHQKQSVFADSLVEIYNLTVLKCTGLLSLSCAEVTDGICSIKLFTTRPYAPKEVITVRARLKVFMYHDGKSVSALVTEDFPLNFSFLKLQSKSAFTPG